MRDAELGAHRRHHRLRRHAAGPEDRHLARPDLDRIAVIGAADIRDADQRWVADVHGRAMHRREPRRDLNGADGVGGFQGPHRHHQRTAEYACGLRRDVGAVHGHIAALFDVAHGQAVVQHRLLERKRAADEKRHEIVAPQVAHVRRLGHQLAVFPDPVSRNVGADVDVRAQLRQRRVAGLGHGQQGARLGVALAKMQEVRRQGARQDRQVGLHVSRRQIRRGARQASAAGIQPRLAG